MRCGDLGRAWTDLRDWFAEVDVLVLPRLEYAGPTARLDADLDPTRPATPTEVAATVAQVRELVRRFDVRAVYVGHAAPDAVTVRVVAGGVVHELTLVAAGHPAVTDDEAATTLR
ncbi:MAG: hypothetical protein AUG44_04025 [Actinobacteria bacterium 13_1_20CM_3_71_11]|nr:MAG: hypothetical protein AUG44_04025 [Actinobacteria bacterium 13_1_20CM_3_71_11]